MRNWLWIILLFSISPTLAQNGYNIEYLTTESGLPSDGIKALELDKSIGFLWISTESGLVRYNGSQLTLFSTENFPYLRSDKFYPLSCKPNGEIFAISGNFTCYVKQNTLVPAPPDTRHSTDLINLYLSNGPAKGTFTGINNYDRFLPMDSSLCYVEKTDTLWELRSGTDQRKLVFPLFHNNFTFKIAGNIFIIDNNNDQYYLFDTAAKKLVPISLSLDEPGSKIADATIKRHFYWQSGMAGPIMLAGTNAWELNYENGQLKAVLICDEIPRNYSIKMVQYWKELGILFLGTTSKGLIIIRKNYLSNIKKNISEFDEPNAIYSQILLPSGNILTNTGDILGPYSNDKNLPINAPFNNNIFLAKDSVLWYSYKDTLHTYHYKDHKSRVVSTMSGSYNLAFATTQGVDYVTNYLGINIIRNDSVINVSRFKGLGDPFDMVELTPGVLAMATGKGLYTFDVRTHNISCILSTSVAVRCLWRHDNYIFIGTYGEGIFIYKNGTIKKIPLDNNAYLSYTHCFMLDGAGYCWMSTNRGLFKARLEDMISAYEKSIPYIYYQFFGRNEGMGITEMNGGCVPCAIWLKNKCISFPTMDGALWVDPSMPARMPDSSIFIDQVIVNGRKMDSLIADSVFFDSRTNDISLNLGFSTWCDKENLYLQYKVVPYSDKWQKVDAMHPVIRLNNLPSGQYTVHIRKLTGFGENNYVIRTFTFEIQAPWYMRWWGLALLILVFMVIVTIISILANRSSLRRQIRLRNLLDKKTEEILEQNEKLEKNDRIKTRLISIISHDIITPLKFLHMTSKYLSERKSSLSETMQAETLEEVVNTSRELELLSTNILNWIKYQNEERRIVKEKVNLHDVVEQIFTVLRSLAHKNNTELINEIPTDLVVFQFVDPLRIIIYNLVVNAINFTKQGNITVKSSSLNNFIQVDVTDTGMGMSRNQINNLKSDMMIISGTNVNKRSGNGLGYLIIKDLLKMVNGEFDIESTLNKGTTVSITFPAR